MKKYSILMYNFNNYEIMHEPEELDPECDYIYVTDDPTLKSEKWRIVIDPDLKSSSPFESVMFVRYHPFKYANTDVCIVLDGSFQIHKSLRKLYEDFVKSNADIGLHVHFCRTNVIEEYNAWVQQRGYDILTAQKAVNYLKEKQCPLSSNGLYEASFRICKNTEDNELLDDYVYESLKNTGVPGKIDRLDQTVYSALLNQCAPGMLSWKAFPISPKFFFKGFLSHCAHKSNWPLPDISKFDTKGWVFNQEVNLYVG